MVAWAYWAGRIAVLVAVIAGLSAPAFPGASGDVFAQDAANVIEAGSGPLGERSFALVGRNIYGADEVQLFGYLTAVVGLSPADLFAAAPESVETARFTFAGALKNTSSTSRADITTTEGSGTLQIFFNESGGARWSDPASFRSGEIVAEFTIEVSDVLQRQAPGVGVAVGDGKAVQIVSAEFTIEGAAVRFGREGMERRLRYVGALVSGNEAATETALTGSATMTRRDSRPVPLGGTTVEAEATPAKAGEACAGVQPWFDQTVTNLDRAVELGNGVGEETTLETLDGETALTASLELASLASAQRDLEAPADADAANQLAVTALYTVARGLLGLSDAHSGNDAEAFADARATLSDGLGLIARAEETVAAYAASCPEA